MTNGRPGARLGKQSTTPYVADMWTKDGYRPKESSGPPVLLGFGRCRGRDWRSLVLCGYAFRFWGCGFATDVQLCQGGDGVMLDTVSCPLRQVVGDCSMQQIF